MTEEVLCPSCGRGNERGLAETYRMCVHCGADISGAVAGPAGVEVREASLEDMTGAGRPPVQQPPPQQPQYQQPPPGHPQYQQPPPYGQPPGTQPYGGQPYPPGGVPPPPYYGAPMPPGMYPPTYHPGVYERPERAPYLDFGNLIRLLTRPKEAFEDLWDHTSATQGIILAMVFIVTAAVLNIMGMYVILGSWDILEEADTTLIGANSAAMTIVSMIMNVLMFFAAAWMVHAFLKGPGTARHPSLSRTIGFMGYAKFPFFIITVIVAFANPLMLSTIDLDAIEDGNPEDVFGGFGAFLGTCLLVFALQIIGFIWAIWVHSHAQSVANDTSMGSAFGFILLTWVVIYVITAIVTATIALLVIGSTF